MARQKMKKKIIIALTVLNLCFIWGNSALRPEISNAISDKVTKILGGEVTGGSEEAESSAMTWLTSGHVRKLAHMAEFAALAVLLAIGASAAGCRMKDVWSQLLLIGVLTALIDETIQIFSGRTSAVKDVWIDCGGFALGAAAAALLRYLRKRLRKRARAD